MIVVSGGWRASFLRFHNPLMRAENVLISALIAGPESNVERIERTLTDGYARALILDAERLRLERRLAEAACNLQPGDREEKTVEVSELAMRLNGNARELDELRARLGELRRLR